MFGFFKRVFCCMSDEKAEAIVKITWDEMTKTKILTAQEKVGWVEIYQDKKVSSFSNQAVDVITYLEELSKTKTQHPEETIIKNIILGLTACYMSKDKIQTHCIDAATILFHIQMVENHLIIAIRKNQTVWPSINAIKNNHISDHPDIKSYVEFLQTESQAEKEYRAAAEQELLTYLHADVISVCATYYSRR